MTIKLDTETLRYMAALGKTTGAQVVDCIVDGTTIIYVVEQGQLGTAIGKGGVNVKRLSTQLGRKMHIIELHSDPVQFTGNLLGGEKNGRKCWKNIFLKEDGETKRIVIESDLKSRGTILGKGGKNIEMIKNLLKRHHGIEDVIVR